MKFLESLREAKKRNNNVVIPDIKCYSPKEGDLMKGRNPVDYALRLCQAGAPVLSVVTEEKEFHGSLEILKAISQAVSVPILRKDFIHTREDLIATKEAGASAILLMCSCLKKDELRYLYQEALLLGLDPFVETHEASDMDFVKELGAELVGINNRDITILERDNGDVSRTCGLIELAPKNAFVISESSIQNAFEVRKAIEAGADAALVGTAILRAKHTESFYRMMCRKTSLKICGLMNPEDVALCVSEGVDRIGFVGEYPVDVPWNLDVDTAIAIRNSIPEGFTSCMVVGGSNEKILNLVDQIHPDAVQLHYKESKADLLELIPQLHQRKIRVIKTIPNHEEDWPVLFGTADLKEVIDILVAAGADELLVDPRYGNDVASKTLSADTNRMKLVQALSPVPVILAGGITADNLKEKLAKTGASYVDIMNGSEDAPGKKSPAKIAAILSAIN